MNGAYGIPRMGNADLPPNEKQPVGKIFGNIRFALRLAWQISPRFLIGYIVDGLLLGIYGVLDAIYLEKIFDALDEGAPLQRVFLLVAGFFVVMLLMSLGDCVYRHAECERQKLVIRCGIQLKFFGHAVKLDIDRYECPEFYNDFIWSVRNTDLKIIGVTDRLRELCKNIIQFLAIFTIILSIDVFAGIFIAVMTGMTTFLSVRINKYEYLYNMESRPQMRMADYVHRVYYMPEYAKELRTGDVKESLDGLYEASLDGRRTLIDRYIRRVNRLGVLSGVLEVIKTNGLLLLLLYRMMVTHHISLGGFSLGVLSSWRVSNALKSISSVFTKLALDSQYIEQTRTFLAQESRMTNGTRLPNAFETLEMRDVSFSYDEGTEVLSHVSLTLHKGEKVAIVGYNGAGKTTLIKLLMRLYDVKSGQILLNGIDIREYDITAYRSMIAAVFQDFVVFAATVAENVTSDVFDKEDTDREKGKNVLAALNASLFTERLSDMENGINTELSREFAQAGVNLSGGENQKIAIARALYKQAPLTVMDEPSSALDPVAEYELNERIMRALDDRTVIFISHRLSTTRDAHVIYMFENGRIIESGTHDALIALKGKYAQMFELQARKYRMPQEEPPHIHPLPSRRYDDEADAVTD